MTAFALVHGGWHGAWCWERLAPLLQAAGHDVVAMDLPSEDGSATFDTYADVVCTALHGHSDDVVLVGIRVTGTDELVMLNPVSYEQGLSVPDEQLRQVWTDLDLACAMFYGDCDIHRAARTRSFAPTGRGISLDNGSAPTS